MSSTGVSPTWVGELELGDGSVREVVGPLGFRHSSARILVKSGGVPVRSVDVERPKSLEDITQRVLEALDDWRPADMDVPDSSLEALPISVAVCTRNRSDQLVRCIARLRNLAYANFEVLIVDNDPSDDQTLKVYEMLLGDDERFRYLVEPRRGLSNARNRALKEARHRIVAFTDDDAVVDERWLSGIALGFGRANSVACVTGFIGSAELETPAQHYFDRHSGWPTKVEGRVFDLSPRSRTVPSYPFSAGIFGAGANFAVDRDFALKIGGFDPDLGAGSRVGGGEDLDFFIRVLFARKQIAYEPSALVWHVHRVADEDLNHQLYQWGRGLAAYLTKTLLEPSTRWTFVARIPASAIRVLQVWRDGVRSSSDTAPLSGVRRFTIQGSGMFTGAFLYLWSRLVRPKVSSKAK